MTTPAISRPWRPRLPGGLTILPHDWPRAGVVVALAVLGVSAFVVAVDLTLRSHLTPAYLARFTSRPLEYRMMAMAIVAVFEEACFRLLWMTGLIALAAALWRRTPPAAVFVAAAVAVQFIDVYAQVLADPLYGSLRYLAVGTVWGLIYWRHGWLAAAVAHAATHLVLDPALLAVLG